MPWIRSAFVPREQGILIPASAGKRVLADNPPCGQDMPTESDTRKQQFLGFLQVDKTTTATYCARQPGMYPVRV